MNELIKKSDEYFKKAITSKNELASYWFWVDFCRESLKAINEKGEIEKKSQI